MPSRRATNGSTETMGGQATRTARTFASPGEYEPVSFALRPKERLTNVMITASDLKGPAGTIPAANLRVQSVEGYHGPGGDILMDLGHTWNMAAWSKELFWVTVRVPDDARPGTYTGKVTVTSDSKAVAAMEVELEVLPIRLADPPYALGYNYSSPKDAAALAAHLADMREHGMTVVAPLYAFHLPIDDDDTSELGAFIQAYLKAGYRQPVYFAAPMGLTLTGLTGYGTADSMRFQQKYIEVMRKMDAETQKHPIPVLFSIGDEFTNKGVKGVEYAGAVARLTWEELPEIPTTSDMNGYKEVMAMSPYLNVATFNNGWDGIDRHNEGRRLVNRAFLQELKEKTGAIPWFVNTGSGRFPFGFFFWKMARYGVRGKVEWYYCLEDNRKGSVVRLDGQRIWPTLDYERSREGIDDLKYLCALETAIAEAGLPEPCRPRRAAAIRASQDQGTGRNCPNPTSTPPTSCTG
ncbi:MAG TPA: glycoside hydrolase domain-containing protein [Phycisphaerae bacterium]|nr:glycoside hydrolase domain-containing protein [Phycisphaerae bacterium]